MADTTTSRSARAFMRRAGIIPTGRQPRSSLDTGRLAVNALPLVQRELDGNLMLDANGNPPPDRGRTDAWPPPREVSDVTTTG